ncbi:MAG TPA: NAD(P)H-binding protein, partial [Gemmatimonadales bacterium]
MILVVGSTGLLGSEIVDQLVRSGEQVRAMAWTGDDPAVVEKVRNLGADVVLGDLRDPDSLRAACAGISAVITTASSVPFCYRPGENTPKITDEDGALSLVDVAGKSGVDHFVYISFPVAPAKFPLQDAKRAVEGALPGSGMSYSILRPTFFPEVWLSPEVGFDYA